MKLGVTLDPPNDFRDRSTENYACPFWGPVCETCEKVVEMTTWQGHFSKARDWLCARGKHFLHKALHASEGSERIFSYTGPSKGHPKKVYLLVPERKRQEENRDGTTSELKSLFVDS
ncbi:hypothetical protein RUM43_004036 [Polyplax serrata]|uniref:Uncharacterized protein n=1 Tax=Polyplax serrata TaxID=468196 RepID=A0AAN8XKV1_POLSC